MIFKEYQALFSQSYCPEDEDVFPLQHCMLGNFSFFCCRLLTFYKLTFSKNSFRNTIRVSNRLDPDQDRHSVGPDLGPNCLQTLSAGDKSCKGLNDNTNSVKASLLHLNL